MHPELFRIPIFDHPVKSYGAMLTLGFLSAVWLSMKRAERLKCDPDLMLNLGFVSLVCGVAGARIFYVLHYWETSFANHPNPLFAALNCTSGGLEYYGGLLAGMGGCVIYILIKRASLRVYLDILTPCAMWGLAFGRMGCLLNGCCWGGLCVDPHGHETVPWGIQFPHQSPAQIRQWENRQLTLPAELIVTDPRSMIARLVPRSALEMTPEERATYQENLEKTKDELDQLKAEGADAKKIDAAQAKYRQAKAAMTEHGLLTLQMAQRYPSRHAEHLTDRITLTELEDLAYAYRSLKVHPAQIYGIINAVLLSWLLLEILYHRKRHGIVFAIMCIIYPITRVILEIVRVDNPHDSAGLTISQAVSVGMFVFGIIVLIVLYRLPERSPYAVAYVPPPEEEG